MNIYFNTINIMNIYFNKKKFNIDDIYIKKNNKLIYNINNFQLLGIPFCIKNFEYNIINNILYVQLLNNDDIFFFSKIDEFFKKKFKNYRSFISDNLITIKNISNTDIKNEINICINGLKTKDFIFYLNIITI